MNLRLFAILMTIAFATGAHAITGGMEGGGGRVVVCRNKDNSIRSAEVLDLYEGRVIYHLNYKESPVSWKTQASAILNRGLGNPGQTFPPTGIYDWYQNAINHLTFLPPGTVLKTIHDSDGPIIPSGCKAEQAVDYVNDQSILVSGEIWQALSQTQRAALMIHEATYRYLRQFGETDSRRARHFTAFLVSGGHVEKIFPGNNYALYCDGSTGGKETQFYVLKLPPDKSGNSVVRLQFGIIGGRHLLSPSYVDIGDNDQIIAQLKKPDEWLRMEDLTLKSLFEPGDSIDLWFHQDQQGHWVTQILGTSAVDESEIQPVNITCF